MTRIDLSGKTAIITGAARGIGRAIAERLLDSGAQCSLWDIDETALKSTAAEIDQADRLQIIATDITNPAQIRSATTATQERFGGIEILVNNAGIAGASKKLWELTPEEWLEVLHLDLYGVFLCCHGVVPLMLTRKWGRIVNIASIAGKEGNPNASHYSAAKAGVIGLTKSLGKELARTGVLVNCITPAVVQTDILRQMSQEHIDYMLSKIPMARFGLKEEVAAMTAWLCSEECSFTTGGVFDLSGGRATY